MSKKTIISVIVASIVLTACNDPKEANKENFAKAVQEELTVQNEPAICLPTPNSSIYIKDDSPLKDAAFVLLQDENDKEKKAAAEFFLNEGLVSKESSTIEQSDWGKMKKVNIDVYSLTEKGKSIAVQKRSMFSNSLDFCSGKIILDQIGTFTEPSERNGMKASRVNFTVKIEGLADWVEKAKAIESFKYRFDKMNEPSRRTDLVLTNEGWKSYKLLK